MLRKLLFNSSQHIKNPVPTKYLSSLTLYSIVLCSLSDQVVIFSKVQIICSLEKNKTKFLENYQPTSKLIKGIPS